MAAIVMLVIRQAQLEALRRSMDGPVSQRIAAFLRDHHPSEVATLADDELLRRVAIGIRRGRARGLTSEADLGAFCALMFVVAPDFDDYPTIAALFEHADGDLGHVVRNATASDWAIAGAAPDPQAVWQELE